jgi:hypothetical protein
MIASIKKDILVLEGKSSDCNKRIAQAVASMMMVREASVKMNEDVRVIKGRIKQSLPLDDEDSLDKAIRMEEKGRKKREEGKGL